MQNMLERHDPHRTAVKNKFNKKRNLTVCEAPFMIYLHQKH